MRARASTTPVSDKKMAEWREHDKLCEHVNATENEFNKARCKKCNSRFRFVMSEYAMKSGNHNQDLMTCDCARMVWFTRIEK